MVLDGRPVATARVGHRLARGQGQDRRAATIGSACASRPIGRTLFELSGGNIQRVLLTRELGAGRDARRRGLPEPRARHRQHAPHAGGAARAPRRRGRRPHGLGGPRRAHGRGRPDRRDARRAPLRRGRCPPTTTGQSHRSTDARRRGMTAVTDAPPTRPSRESARDGDEGCAARSSAGSVAILGALAAVQRPSRGQRRRTPIEVLRRHLDLDLHPPRSLQEILNTMAPIALAGLAVVVPARAGMSNVGGEGQLHRGRHRRRGRRPGSRDQCRRRVVLVLMMLAANGRRRRVGGIAGGAAARRPGQRGGHHAAPQLRRAGLAALPHLPALAEGPAPVSRPRGSSTDVAKLPVIAGTRHRHRHRDRRRRRHRGVASSSATPAGASGCPSSAATPRPRVGPG